MINRSTYEMFFIDYFDGKLDEKSRKELFSFLDNNPDLKKESESFNNEKVSPDTSVKYSFKDALKKETITRFNYKTWFVAFVEGDLNRFQKKDLEKFLLLHPYLKTELEL